MLTQLINARILTPQGWMKDGSVLIRDNKILEVTNCDLAVIGAELIDVKGMYVVPGGVEIHGAWWWRPRLYGMYGRCFPGSGPYSHETWHNKYLPHTVIIYSPHDSTSCRNLYQVD